MMFNNRIKFVTLLSVLLMFATSLLAQVRAPKHGAQVTVVIKDIPVNKSTLRLVAMPYYVHGAIQKNLHTAIDATGKNGVYHFQVPDLHSISYFTVLVPYDTVSNSVLERVANEAYLEPGDSLVMTVTKWDAGIKAPFKYKVEYAGRGAGKNNCFEKVRFAGYQTSGNGLMVDSSYKAVTDNVLIKKTAAMMQVLDSFKTVLSPAAYDQLLVDVTYFNREAFMNNMRYIYQRAKREGKESIVNQMIDSLNAIPLVGTELARVKSRFFGGALIMQLILEQVQQGKPAVYPATYAAFKKLPPLTRDRATIQFLQLYNNALTEFDSLVVDARRTVTSPDFITMLDRFGTVALGSVAPPFELRDAHGKLVKLSDFKNKVVFIDFWFTGCTACIYYYKQAVHPVQEYYRKNKDVVFISISVDRSKSMWLRSVASGQYTNADHVNLRTGDIGSNHPLVTAYNIAGYPNPLLIDATGKISKIRDISLKRKDELQEAIGLLLAQAAHDRNLGSLRQ